MSDRKVLGRNRRAFHEYSFDDTVEVGIELRGTEVKSIRANSFSFADAYARIRRGQLYLIGLHIAEYSHGTIYNHEPMRDRRLLAHRSEIDRLRKKVEERGFTLIPTEIYLKAGIVKVSLGLGKGKKLYDKRQTVKRRDQERDLQREIRLDR